MNVENIKEILLRKLNEEKLNRIFLNGKWGIGKTYLWNSIIKSLQNRKIVYVSLFGIDSMKVLIENVKVEVAIVNGLISKEILGSELGKDLTNFVGRIGAGLLKKISIDVGAISLHNLLPLNNDEKFIFCFDDIERMSDEISLKNLLGFIEEVSKKSSVIIIGNKEEFSEPNKETYNGFKEKVIDFEYIVDTIEEETLFSILREEFSNILKYRMEIIPYFQYYGDNNIRIYKKILYYINKLDDNFRKKYNRNATDELIYLLSKIIIRDLTGDKEELKEENSLENGNIKEIKFNISVYAEETSRALQQLYFQNTFEEIVFNDYFENIIREENGKGIKVLLEKFKEHIFYSKKQNEQEIKKIIDIINRKDKSVFKKVYELIEMFYLIKKIEIDYDTIYLDKKEINNMFEIADELLDEKVDSEIYYDYSTAHFFFDREISFKVMELKEFLKVINEKRKIKQKIGISKIIADKFRENNFKEASRLVNTLNFIEFDLKLLERLIDENIDTELWTFFHIVCSKHNYMSLEFKEELKNKIKELSDSTDDILRKKIIYERINQYGL